MQIVVFTCDKYNWLIPYFWHFFEKTNLPYHYKTHFITESEKIYFGHEVYYAGKGKAWTDIVCEGLKTIPDDKVLILLDDYILWYADLERLKKAENLINNDNIKVVGLQEYNYTKPYLIDEGMEMYKTYPLSAPSSAGIQATIWDKDFFISLQPKGQNSWKAEHLSTDNIRKTNAKVIMSLFPILDYVEGGCMKKGIKQEKIFQMMAEKW